MAWCLPARKPEVHSVPDAPSRWLRACSSLSILTCRKGTIPPNMDICLKHVLEGPGLQQCRLSGHPWAACLCGLTGMGTNRANEVALTLPGQLVQTTQK